MGTPTQPVGFMSGLMGAIQPTIDQKRADAEKLKDAQAQIYSGVLKNGGFDPGVDPASASDEQRAMAKLRIDHATEQLGKIYGHKEIKGILGKVGQVAGHFLGAPKDPGLPPGVGGSAAAQVLPPPAQARAVAPGGGLTDEQALSGAGPTSAAQVLPPPGGSASSVPLPGAPVTPTTGATPRATAPPPGSALPPPSWAEMVQSATGNQNPVSAENRKAQNELKVWQGETDIVRKDKELQFDSRMARAKAIIGSSESPEVKSAQLQAIGITSSDGTVTGPTEIKGIPGSKITAKADAFGNPVDPASTYTRTRDGNLYPEKPPTEKFVGELGQRTKANEILVDPKSSAAEKDAARKTLKHLDTTERGAETRIFVQSQNTPGTVSEDDLRTLARREIETAGQLKPTFSMRDPNRARYATIAAQEWRKDPDNTTAMASYKAGTANLAQLQKIRGLVGFREDSFKLDIQNALDAADGVDRSSLAKLNSLKQLYEKNFTDDPELAQLKVATQTAVNAYANIMSSGGRGGVTTDTARREAEGLLDSAMAKHTFAASLAQMQKEAQNMITGIDQQIAQQRAGMRSGPAGKTLPPPTGNVVDPKSAKWEKTAGGGKAGLLNGKWYDTSTGKEWK